MRALSRAQIAGGLLTIAVIAAAAIGIQQIGSPAEERLRRLDERRVQDLAAIADAMDLYWTRHARFPASFDELRREPGANIRLNDPGTNDPYEYRPVETETYELCARFERGSPETGLAAVGAFWSHGAGRQCFRREVRKIR
jgi:hypothetical protein